MTTTHRAVSLWFAQHLRALPLLFTPPDVDSDLRNLAEAFTDPASYQEALAHIVQQLVALRTARPGTAMRGRLAGWRRHAFQSQPTVRGSRADLRIVYRIGDNGSLELLGFGHRHRPDDFYQHLRARPARGGPPRS